MRAAGRCAEYCISFAAARVSTVRRVMAPGPTTTTRGEGTRRGKSSRTATVATSRHNPDVVNESSTAGAPKPGVAPRPRSRRVPVASGTSCKAVYDVTQSPGGASPGASSRDTVIIRLNVVPDAPASEAADAASQLHGSRSVREHHEQSCSRLAHSGGVVASNTAAAGLCLGSDGLSEPLAYNDEMVYGASASYDAAPPSSVAYERGEEHAHDGAASFRGPTAIGTTMAAAASADDTGTVRAIRLLMEFDEKCKNGEWPASTTVHCYWCCHQFKGTPVGIPLSYCEDSRKFMVYGCFCSCECAAAYNLDSKESADEIMTRHAYLNMMAHELGHTRSVRPAPDRLTLKMFGGPFDIDEFRAYGASGKLAVVNFPPMMTVTQQVEEINQRDLRSEYRFIPLDNDRVNKYKEKIKLKRTKPLVNFQNTLDHAMNLRFGQET